MRNIYFPALLLAMILSFSLWCTHYTKEYTEKWTDLLQDSLDASSRQDWQEAGKRLAEAHSSWSQSQSLYQIIMDHDDLESAELLFIEAETACEEHSGMVYRLLVNALMAQLQALSGHQTVSIENIM